MLYLFLAILSSTLVSVFLRLSEGRSRNNITLLAFNYVMCTALAWVRTGCAQVFPQMEGLGFSMGLGLVSGTLFLVSFVALQWNIRHNGVVLPPTFMKLGVLVPTLMSITIFREAPTVMQLAGFALAVLAILLIQGEKDGSKAKSRIGLVVLLLLGGLCDSTVKVHDFYGNAQLGNHFLMYNFAVALVLCILLCVIKKQSIAPADAGFGLLIGIPNYLSSLFLMMSLKTLPAVISYPTYSVGGIIMVTLAGILLFRERPSRKQYCALVIIMAALALLNL